MSFPLKNVRLLATNLFKEGVAYHARVGETQGALPEFVLVVTGFMMKGNLLFWPLTLTFRTPPAQ